MLKKQMFHLKKEKKYWSNWDKYYKMKHYEISKLLNDPTVSKFATKIWTGVNYLSGGQYSASKTEDLKVLWWYQICENVLTCILL